MPVSKQQAEELSYRRRQICANYIDRCKEEECLNCKKYKCKPLDDLDEIKLFWLLKKPASKR